MLAAEIYRKVSSELPPSERLEDVLTSNVFSAFRYFGSCRPLIAWLGRAVTLDRETLRLEATQAMHVAFWPGVSVGARLREPDVLIEVIGDDGGRLPIVIEAKYESGPTDLNYEDVADGRGDAGFSGNQLADYWIGLERGRWSLPSETGRVVMSVADPRLRVLGNAGLTFMVKAASGYWANFDPANGYVACYGANTIEAACSRGTR